MLDRLIRFLHAPVFERAPRIRVREPDIKGREAATCRTRSETALIMEHAIRVRNRATGNWATDLLGNRAGRKP